MRGLLVWNPVATCVSPRVADILARALSTEVKLDVIATEGRGHALEVASTAPEEGYDLVFCLAGDGTLNEVVNGLAGSDVPIVPLPGGGTNVLARTLGLPRDAVEAASVVLDKIQARARPRRLPVGRANGRAFAFCAGFGFDAEVVRAVERSVHLRRRLGDWLFVSNALRLFFFSTDRSRPALTLRAGGEEVRDLYLAIVGNTSPYTFLGRWPFQICPLARPEGGLEVTALRSMRTHRALRVVWRAFGSGGHLRLPYVHARHDLASFEIMADRPVPLQLDGDYLGEESRLEITLEPDALSVLA